MNKLIFLAAIIPILLVPNTYASPDNPTRLSDEDFNAAVECGNQGYDDEQNGDFDQGKNEECEELNRKLYDPGEPSYFSTPASLYALASA